MPSARRQRQLRPISHLMKRLRLGWGSKVFSASRATDYVARLFLGVTTGAVEASERSFQPLAATHATAGGINEQFL
jgi:hypothetical protein